MSENKQIQFRVPLAVFEVYEAEAKRAEELGYDVSPTAQIKAEVIKQAKIKEQVLQIEIAKENRQPSVLDVFDDI